MVTAMKVGPYQVKVQRRANCRRLVLRYHRIAGEWTLTAPKGVRMPELRAFVEAQLPWMRQQAGAPFEAACAAGERHMLLGRRVTLGQDVPCGRAFLVWRREVMLRRLEQLTAAWASRMGLPMPSVTLRRMKASWGRCSREKCSITYSEMLGMAPEEYVEYVVVHELCHLVHANHSAAFYDLLAHWMPDWQSLRRGLNDFPMQPLPPER